MEQITIYHNPNCGTSRNTLAMIRNTGIEPNIIYYLETPPGRAKLVQLIDDMRISVRDLLRQKDTPYNALNLNSQKWTDDELIDFMVQYPILMNRPIVITSRGTKLCRPSETVLDILPLPQLGPFAKEDGEIVIDKDGRRIK